MRARCVLRREGEKEKEEIDKGSARAGHAGKMRRKKSRYVSLDMFLSSVKLSRGFMCLFISPLAQYTPCSGIYRWRSTYKKSSWRSLSKTSGSPSLFLTPSFAFSVCLSGSVAASSFWSPRDKKFGDNRSSGEHHRVSPESTKKPPRYLPNYNLCLSHCSARCVFWNWYSNHHDFSFYRLSDQLTFQCIARLYYTCTHS